MVSAWLTHILNIQTKFSIDLVVYIFIDQYFYHRVNAYSDKKDVSGKAKASSSTINTGSFSNVDSFLIAQVSAWLTHVINIQESLLFVPPFSSHK